MIRHLIFDMDGTLADTCKATVPACAELAPRFGLPAPTPEAVRAAMGIANPDFYYRLFPDCDRSVIRECGAAVDLLEAKLIRKLGPEILFPGVRELLRALDGLGYALYIASTGDPEHVDVALQSAGIMHLFRGIHCGRSEKVAMVAAIIGSGDKSEWAMIGDRDKDLRAARENGILAVAAGFGYCEPADWPLFDVALEAPGDLMGWVQGHGAPPQTPPGASPLDPSRV